jgi:hypothetical protein
MADAGNDMEQIASSVVQDLQFRDVMHFYNSTVEQCFKQCINSFQTRSVCVERGLNFLFWLWLRAGCIVDKGRVAMCDELLQEDFPGQRFVDILV